MKSNLIYLKKLELFNELESLKDEQFFAVADLKIKNHLPQWISFSPNVFWIKSPEQDKSFDGFENAIEFFLKSGINRTSTIYAFGGGATTDLAGFVASTILRGIEWVAIPTTLLGMVDGAIGGKVAINMSIGKNLLGSFHLPRKVFICADFLTSLPPSELISGKGEILKYGFLSKEINELILNKAPLEEITMACAKYKNNVVERDMREKGERILFNLGHTLGHAFEMNLKIPHGHAVAMGIKYILKIMKNNEGFANWQTMIRALGLVEDNFDIEKFPHFDIRQVVSFIEQDKKRTNSALKLVLVNEIGGCYVEEVPLNAFKTKVLSYEEFNS